MARKSEKKPAARCGAKTRSGSPCVLTAGSGTDHAGIGKCWRHGGRAGAPEGNKNALKHGLYEQLHFDNLTEEERKVYSGIGCDPLESALVAYKLLSIREARMMKRRRELEEQEYILVEEIHAKGYQIKGAVDVVTKTKRLAQEEILRVEEALNALAGRKTKIIELLAKLYRPEEERMTGGLMEAILASLGDDE